MDLKKKILFIVNPNSGTSQINNLKELISSNLDASIFEYAIAFTQAPKHATEIAKNASQQNIFACIAVGGDGSVNETATGLIGAETAIGIIPKGSGNGLARHLKIPINVKKAIQTLNKLHLESLDIIKINKEYAVNVAGCGFDGHIAHLFAASKARGLMTYSKLCFKEYFNYQPQEYTLTIDDTEHKLAAFTVAIANSSQFGNDVLIAPEAKTNDGLINITVVKPFNKLNFVTFLYYLGTKQFHKAPFVKTFTCTQFSISSNQKITGHIDGEAVELGNTINGTIIANALKVLT